MKIISKTLFRYSTYKLPSIPIVDTTNFLTNQSKHKNECMEIAEALHKYGCVIIKDPRVQQSNNDTFLNMMEKYFESRGQMFYQGQQIDEIFPEKYYQVGATPEFIEKAREHKLQTSKYSDENKPVTSQPPPFDAKWRYFWQMSDSNDKSKFIYDNVTPVGFPEWEQNMELWGSMMVQGCFTVAEMAAEGMDLPRDSFSRLMKGGHHLLAPTASDLQRYDVSTIFAGLHYDLNFLSIHGKSRYPGLFVWLKSGERVSVAVPEGHLLLQAGKQFEILTGGYVTCGFHEVVYTEAIKQRVQEAKQKGNSTWRISSTLFSHINYDVLLRPLNKFDTDENRSKYPAINAYQQVQSELKAISLKME